MEIALNGLVVIAILLLGTNKISDQGKNRGIVNPRGVHGGGHAGQLAFPRLGQRPFLDIGQELGQLRRAWMSQAAES